MLKDATDRRVDWRKVALFLGNGSPFISMRNDPNNRGEFLITSGYDRRNDIIYFNPPVSTLSLGPESTGAVVECLARGYRWNYQNTPDPSYNPRMWVGSSSGKD